MRPAAPAIALAVALLATIAVPPIVLRASSAPRLAPRAIPGEDDDLSDLVSRLGSDDWADRERAQAGILERGLDAVDALERALERALGDGNPELALRARYLLERIDPEITEFRVLRIRLSDPPRVVESAFAHGTEGEEILASTAPGDPSATAYAIRFRSSPGGLLDIRVADVRRGVQRTELRRPLSHPGAVSILATSEVGTYRRMGLTIERDRTRHVTLLATRRGRRSQLADPRVAESQPAESQPAARKPDGGEDDAVERLSRTLQTQSRAESPALRAEAVTILAALRPEGFRPILEAALLDPATRHAAASGLDDEAILLEALRAGDDGPALLAALRLARDGSGEGWALAVDRLSTAGPFEFHSIAAEMADRIRRNLLPEDAREVLLDRVLAAETLAGAPWTDIETEYFYSEVLGLLRHGSEGARRNADRRRALGFLRDVERVLGGEMGAPPPPAKICINLWLKARAVIPDEVAGSKVGFCLRTLPSVRDAASLSEILACLEREIERGGDGTTDGSAAVLGPGRMTDGDLRRLCESLAWHVGSGDASRIVQAMQWLLRIVRAIEVERGQLRIIVEALVRAGEAASRSPAALPVHPSGAATPATLAIRQAEQELLRWTRVAVPARRSAAAASFEGKPWLEWLASEDDVRMREDEIIATRAASAGEDPPRRFAFYEFDLELGPRPPAGTTGPRPRAFLVLAGRRIECEEGRSVPYRDPWGNDLSVLIEVVESPGSPAPRVRVNKRSLPYLGVPDLSQPSTREFAVARYEFSDVQPAARAVVSGEELPSFRSVLCVVPVEGDGVRTTPDGALWDGFLQAHVLGLGPDAPAHEIQGALALLRALDIPGRTPLLRRIFAEGPSVELARLLHEAGDPGGLPFLRREVEREDVDARIRASVALCDLGYSEGFTALGALLSREPSRLRVLGYQILNAMEGYLNVTEETADRRHAALGIIIDGLASPPFSEPSLRSRAFRLIQREAGSDFGYDDAQSIEDQRARGLAVEAAVERARSWYAGRRS